MQQIDKMIWISFEKSRRTKEVTGMRYAVGTRPVHIWNLGQFRPPGIVNALTNNWPVIASLKDQEIYESLMEQDLGWPIVNNWIAVEPIGKVNGNA